MAVGKGSILRASNANAAAREKKVEKAASAVENKSVQEKDGKVTSAKSADIAVKAPEVVAKVPVDALKNVPKTWGIPVLDAARIASLKDSIQAYGMLMPVIVYKNKKQELLVLKGNHRIAAAKEAGLGQVPVAFVEADTDAMAKAIYAELRSFDKAGETQKEYEVISSITVNMPSYLL